MEVLYHGIKTRYAYDFLLCFFHELIMSLRNIILKTLYRDVGVSSIRGLQVQTP